MRILLVDDDAGLRALLPTTFEVSASSSKRPTMRLPRRKRPEASPRGRRPRRAHAGGSGLDLCRDLNADSATDGISVVLTGSNGGTAESAAAAGAARVSILAAR
jgi:hypothetical protein